MIRISFQVADDKIQGFDLIAQGWTNTDSSIFTIIDKQTNQLTQTACLTQALPWYGR